MRSILDLFDTTERGLRQLLGRFLARTVLVHTTFVFWRLCGDTTLSRLIVTVARVSVVSQSLQAGAGSGAGFGAVPPRQ